MARKKSNRVNLPQQTLDRARRAAGQQVEPDAAPEKVKVKPKGQAKAAPQVKKVTMEDLAQEYAYVLTDLRNMGLLAAALFAVLIAISFVL